jgi:integrase
MARSLTKRVAIRVGEYLIRQRQRHFAVQGASHATEGRKFSLWEMTPGRWRANLNDLTGRHRKKFKAKSLVAAVEKADNLFFASECPVSVGQISIADCFMEWRKSLSCSESTIEMDYWPRVRQCVRWADSHSLTHWNELRLQHLQLYAGEAVKAGNMKRTIQLKCRVVSMAARWAAFNWPEVCRDFTQGFRLPKGSEGNRRLRRDSLSLRESVQFLLFLRGQPLGWNILPGVVLGALCSLRPKEIRGLRWMDVDLVSGLIRITGRDVKTAHSERTIPIPALARDILAEAKRRQQPALTDPVVTLTNGHSYWRAFTRYRDKWRPGLNLEPSGLRRVLRSEWFNRRWHAELVAQVPVGKNGGEQTLPFFLGKVIMQERREILRGFVGHDPSGLLSGSFSPVHIDISSTSGKCFQIF